VTKASERDYVNNIRLSQDPSGYAEALVIPAGAGRLCLKWVNAHGKGQCWVALARIYHDQGRYAEALDYYQQALKIAAKWATARGKE